MKRCSTPGEELLAEYIVLATFGLVAPARERIQMEIEAHYAEGVSRRLGEGMLPEQAEIAAAQELGDPHAAARQYRRRYLTEDEASWLRRFEGQQQPLRLPMRTIRWLALGLGTVSVLLTCFGVSLVEPGDRERVIAFYLANWLGVAVFIGAAVRSWRWRARLPSGPQLWRKLLGFGLIQFQLGCFFCAAQFLITFWVLRLPNERAAELSAGVLLLSVLPVFFTKRFCLWRKLRFKHLEAASTLA